MVIEVDTSNHYSKARFADTDIEGSLMMDMFYIEIYEKQIIIQESEADFPTVAIRAHIDGSEINVRLVDIDIQENRIVDKLRAKDENQFTTRDDKADVSSVVIRTNMGGSLIVNKLKARVNKIDCMGPHLAPTYTDRYYSNVDREVDNDGDRTVSVLQWLERKSRKRCQSADRDSGPTVHLQLHLQGGGDFSRQSTGRDSGPAVHGPKSGPD